MSNWKPTTTPLRNLRCPYCGYCTNSAGIGAVYCGPHGHAPHMYPAIRMTENPVLIKAALRGEE